MSAKRTPRQRFRVELEAKVEPATVPALRKLLKVLIRQYGIRCRSIRRLKDAKAA